VEAPWTGTPYERYVLESIEQEKKNLDSLYDKFAHSSILNKQLLRRKIDETLQNIELLSKDLEKYRAGLSWLREPSKERDEKAQSLEKIQEEPQAKPAAVKPAAAPSAPRPSVGTSVVGTPSPRPIIGTPQASPPRPRIGTPVVGTPKKEDEQSQETKQS
jgi:hypothetical protein